MRVFAIPRVRVRFRVRACACGHVSVGEHSNYGDIAISYGVLRRGQIRPTGLRTQSEPSTTSFGVYL
eukprot:4142582-Pleurochrysis_carterae.AAC.1